ncbi:GPP34 family phosphoprotein [Streptomyces sp. NBC_00124]|uniref:GOLPH3/VPS74 family protein n=1 Tax=Streptomyces sp. NBC_00124 TaxID=2975662 RepID=UPI00225343BD|nr:GPP34 family phosphoprotein [Streptomyces sp. NBC_00124]MCX5359398.1 GPP34 family phosphoprotein [Streptomyces sp. NBC_00124]
MPNGSLSLPARLYLLAWDTTRNELAGTAHLVRAGALTELAQRGLLVDDDGIATPVDMDSGTGDAVLDGLLELVRESRPHRWRSWVPLHARVTAEAVREQLAAEGYLRADKRRALGLFPTVEYALERVAAVDALREEARQVLEGPVRPADVSDRDAALVVLAAAAGVSALVARKERGQYNERLADLRERSGTAAPGLRKIMDELGTALTAAAAPTGV